VTRPSPAVLLGAARLPAPPRVPRIAAPNSRPLRRRDAGVPHLEALAADRWWLDLGDGEGV